MLPESGKLQEAGFINLSLEYIELSVGQFYQFSQSNGCHVLLFALVCCGSGTALSGDLILVELGGGQCSLLYNHSPFHLNFDRGLGGML